MLTFICLFQWRTSDYLHHRPPFPCNFILSKIFNPIWVARNDQNRSCKAAHFSKFCHVVNQFLQERRRRLTFWSYTFPVLLLCDFSALKIAGFSVFKKHSMRICRFFNRKFICFPHLDLPVVALPFSCSVRSVLILLSSSDHWKHKAFSPCKKLSSTFVGCFPPMLSLSQTTTQNFHLPKISQNFWKKKTYHIIKLKKQIFIYLLFVWWWGNWTKIFWLQQHWLIVWGCWRCGASNANKSNTYSKYGK